MYGATGKVEDSPAPLIVTGRPVSGLDGETVCVVNGEAIDMPQKFNNKSPKWTDFWCAVLWMISVGSLIGLAGTFIMPLASMEIDSNYVQFIERALKQHFGSMLLYFAGAFVFAVGGMWVLMKFLEANPRRCVNTALYGGPWLIILISVFQVFTVYGDITSQQDVSFAHMFKMIMGFTLFTTGVISVLWSLVYGCCCKHYVELTVNLFEAVAQALRKYNCSMSIALIANLMSLVWLLVAACAFGGVQLMFIDQRDPEPLYYVLLFWVIMVSIWTSGVIHNTAHLAYCKIFGSWYFNTEREMDSGAVTLSTMSSFASAWTFHLGSICVGSLLVAIIRTLELACRYARATANGRGNGLVRLFAWIVLAILESFLSFIGDLLQFFNTYAYVHVGIYNMSFKEAVKSTKRLFEASLLSAVLTFNICEGVLNTLSFAMGSILLFCTSELVPVVIKGTDPAAVLMQNTTLVVQAILVLSIIGSLQSIILSGVNSIFVCYAEHPDTLNKTHPDLALRLSNLIHEAREKRDPESLTPAADVMPGDNADPNPDYNGFTQARPAQ